MPGTTANTTHAVLFATDLSGNSHIALSYAAGLASIYKARLFLVHVLDPAKAANSLSNTSPSELRNLAHSAKSELKSIAESLLAAQGIAGEVLVRHGNVRDVIFQACQEYSADIVVLGSSGRKAGHGKGLGSIAEAILRGMSCSVLTVGPNVRRPFSSASAQAVLFPTDFSAVSLAALPTAISFAGKLDARLLLLHVCDPNALHEVLCHRELSKLVQSIEKQTARVEAFTLEGRIAENIVSFAREENADMLVLGVHRGDLADGTRLHGIVTELVREASCPILTVAEKSLPHLQ